MQMRGWSLRRSARKSIRGLPDVDEAVDTLGGLAFLLAGHVPAVGAILDHDSGWRIEMTAGNERHVTRLRLFPPAAAEDPED